MNTRDRSPLDSDERAITAQLARHAPAGAPAPELDAAVLAAAARAISEAGAASPPLPHARRSLRLRRRRWPAVTGLAASLALAAGVAWQLRPLPAPAPAPVQEDATTRPAAAFRAPPEAQPLPGSTAAPAAAAATIADDAMPIAPASPEATRAPAPAPAAQPIAASTHAMPLEGAGHDSTVEPSAATVMPLVTPGPPPASATVATQRETTAPSSEQPRAMPKGPTAVGRQAIRGTPVPLRTAVAAADAASGMHSGIDSRSFSDEELDDSPPATVDSPEVHRAWLARIRELRDSGRTDDARESLAELRRRFPDLPVPGDLVALAEPAQ